MSKELKWHCASLFCYYILVLSNFNTLYTNNLASYIINLASVYLQLLLLISPHVWTCSGCEPNMSQMKSTFNV